MTPKLPTEVIEAYAFANTPSYLYRKLVSCKFVQDLSLSDEGKIIDQLSELSAPSDPESAAHAYALLVALLRREDRASNKHSVIDKLPLQWAKRIAEIHRSKVVSSSIKHIVLPKVTTSSSSTTSGQSSSMPSNITKVTPNV